MEHLDCRTSLDEVALSPGELVASRYRVVRHLGSGAMGRVYEAYDEKLKVSVALKALMSGIDRGEDWIESLRQEIITGRKVTHRNVCRAHDLCVHEKLSTDGRERFDVAFLTMELLAGETLAERLERCGPLSEAAALPIIEQMCAGLAAAHDEGIAHLDFKSGNVMLVSGESKKERSERVVITDFGLARHLRSNGASEPGPLSCVVSPAYAAPEQVDFCSDITTAADIYSLGVVMYEMVTGNYPFPGEEPLAVAFSRLKDPPVPPRTYDAYLDARWERVILRCLAMRPSDRYQKASDVVQDLKGHDVAFLSRMIRGLSRGRRRRLVPALAAAAVVAVLGAAGWFLFSESAHRSDSGVVDSAPERARELMAYAAKHVEAGDYQGARAALYQARDENPFDADVVADLAAVCLKLGRVEEGRALCHEALRIDSKNVLAHANLAAILAATGDAAGALSELSQALRLSVTNPHPLLTRAQLASRLRSDEDFAGLRDDPAFESLFSTE